MADVTMCSGLKHNFDTHKNTVCKARETCYRYKAKPNEHRQSYFDDAPIVNNNCDYYINNNDL